MKDKEIRKQLIILHGQLYSIRQAIALLIASAKDLNYDEDFVRRYEAVLQRMEDDAAVYTTSLLNDLEARDLTGEE